MLALCRSIVQLNGNACAVSCCGKGCTAWFCLAPITTNVTERVIVSLTSLALVLQG